MLEPPTSKLEAQGNLLLQTLLDRFPEEEGDDSEPQDEQADSASTSTKYNGNSDNGRGTQSPTTVASDLTMLSKQLSFVGHNLIKLLNGMGQKPCSCNDCLKCFHKYLPESCQSISSTGGSAPTTPPNPLHLMTNMGNTFQRKENDEVEYLEEGMIKRGRKSKYCTPERKKQVAAFAELHGATAAAKTFGIPAAVAAYYHRKLRTTVVGDTEIINSIRELKSTKNGFDGDQEEPISLTSQSFSTMHNPQLRGRGRGRPKLIGDDLDAELLEHMVGVKKRVPRGHLTASYALEVARGYIANKQPNLLEENGGPINLKITWAMKLVARTNDRYQELYGNGQSDTVDDLLANLGQNNKDVNIMAVPEIRNIRSLDLSFAFDDKDSSNLRRSPSVIKTELQKNA